MKKLLLFLTTINFVAFATDAQITFQKTYGGTKNDFLGYGHPFQQTIEGGYIMVGITYSFGLSNSNVYLLKTNKYGDTLWTKMYGGTSFDNGYSVQQTSDNGYIIVGYTGSFGFGNGISPDVYLIKTDMDGDTLWTKTFGGWSDDFSWGPVVQTLDRGFIFTGETDSYNGGEIYLVKTDDNGDTLWTRHFTRGGRGNYIQQTFDKGYVIVGDIFTNYNKPDIILLKTDSVGNIRWSKNYGDNNNFDYGRFVEQTKDSGFILYGTTDKKSGLTQSYLIKTDAKGDTLWTRTFLCCNSAPLQTMDGGYIMVAHNSYLLKINSFGDSIWAGPPLGIPDDAWISSIQLTTDGGFIMAGNYGDVNSEKLDFFLLKSDCLGNSTFWDSVNNCPYTNLIEPEKNQNQLQINTYPNPSNGSVTLTTTDTRNIKCTLIIYNVLGLPVYSQILNTKREVINLNLPDGIYFYKVFNKNEEITVGKLIVQRF